MKYCPKCGAQLADEAAFCDKCGTSLGQPAAPSGSAPVQKGGSVLGIAALILSILGFLTGFLGVGIALDVIAIVLAVVVFVQAKKKPMKTGTATGGLVVAVLSIVLCGITMGPALLKQMNVPSESEMLAEAQSVSFREMAIEKYENDVAFTEKYDEKILKVTGYVTDISSSGIVLSWRLGNTYTFTQDEMERMGGDEFFAATWDIRVSFEDESILPQLSKESEITVVGIFDAAGSATLNHAYLVAG